MCLARVYVKEEGAPSEQEAVLSDVAWIEVHQGSLLLRDLLGEEKILQGRISAVDFLKGRVTVTRSEA